MGRGDKGKGIGSHTNFGCSDICWPSPGMLSVHLEAEAYDMMPWYKPGKDEEYHREGFGEKYKYVDVEGPMALAFSDAECNSKSFIGRAIIPKGNKSRCVTFDEPVYGWNLKLLKHCTYEDLKDVADVATDDRMRDWYHPKEADLDQLRNWEEDRKEPKTDADDKIEGGWGVIWKAGSDD